LKGSGCDGSDRPINSQSIQNTKINTINKSSSNKYSNLSPEKSNHHSHEV
jgi:hypothetical protein